MISIDRAQTAAFTLAMAGLIGITLCAIFGFDEEYLALGFASGWVIGVFQTVNHMIIDVSRDAIERRTALKPVSAPIPQKQDHDL